MWYPLAFSNTTAAIYKPFIQLEISIIAKSICILALSSAVINPLLGGLPKMPPSGHDDLI